MIPPLSIGRGNSWKRKEVIGDCTLYLGDCLEIMADIGKVGACISDPPYGCGVKYGDEYNDSRPDYWEWFRTRLDVILSISTVTAFTHRNHALKHLTDWDWIGVWNKPGSFGSRIGNSCILPHWEPIFMYGIHKIGVSSEYLADVLTYNPQPAGAGHKGLGREKWQKDGNKSHPTPKPPPLMKRLIKTIAQNADVILDPFMGSATTLECAAKMGRKAIGIEIEPKYFDIACKRIEDAYRQPDMFVEPVKPAKQEEMLL